MLLQACWVWSIRVSYSCEAMKALIKPFSSPHGLAQRLARGRKRRRERLFAAFAMVLTLAALALVLALVLACALPRPHGPRRYKRRSRRRRRRCRRRRRQRRWRAPRRWWQRARRQLHLREQTLPQSHLLLGTNYITATRNLFRDTARRLGVLVKVRSGLLPVLLRSDATIGLSSKSAWLDLLGLTYYAQGWPQREHCVTVLKRAKLQPAATGRKESECSPAHHAASPPLPDPQLQRSNTKF